MELSKDLEAIPKAAIKSLLAEAEEMFPYMEQKDRIFTSPFDKERLFKIFNIEKYFITHSKCVEYLFLILIAVYKIITNYSN